MFGVKTYHGAEVSFVRSTFVRSCLRFVGLFVLALEPYTIHREFTLKLSLNRIPIDPEWILNGPRIDFFPLTPRLLFQ